MSKLEQFVNRLGSSRSKPVSFEFHCKVGKILEKQHDVINESENSHRVMLDKDHINLLL